jgi:hypothetical protein
MKPTDHQPLFRDLRSFPKTATVDFCTGTASPSMSYIQGSTARYPFRHALLP